MREIKFRAWDSTKMIKVKSIEFVDSENSITGKNGYNINNHLGIPLEYLMQSTSLHDKNGKEIYEGDVGENGFEGGIVVFKNGKFSLEPHENFFHPTKRGDEYWYFIARTNFPNGFVVKGNIFETPELLEQK